MELRTKRTDGKSTATRVNYSLQHEHPYGGSSKLKAVSLLLTLPVAFSLRLGAQIHAALIAYLGFQSEVNDVSVITFCSPEGQEVECS